MSIIFIIILFTFLVSYLTYQIYISNLNKILKFFIILFFIFISSILTALTLFIAPLTLVIIDKSGINFKFNKIATISLSVLLLVFSFNDLKKFFIFTYECNIIKNYTIDIIDTNYNNNMIDKMYIENIPYELHNKSVSKVHYSNIYSDINKTKIIANIYNIVTPDTFFNSQLQKEISGISVDSACGYTYSGMAKYDYGIKTILTKRTTNE